jgi:hypothetical protein
MIRMLVGVDECQRVLNWKMSWLISAGFSVDAAEQIANSEVDFRFAISTYINAKARGYDEEFVLKLLL